MDATIVDLLRDKIDTVDEKVDRIATAQAEYNREIQQKLDVVLAFKWQIGGGVLVLSVLVTAAFQIAGLLLR